ncbi:MAG TPA: hypothetical protein VMU99_04015 [Acidimicrobiales bacterium]|nr:hypothetical protein [Acidimicrobiales bacterium]
MTGTWKIPDEEGGGTINLRLDQTRDDVARKFNRSENLRAFSERWDPDEYSYLANSRNDTESGNRTAKRHLTDKRGRSLGAAGKHLDMLAHAFSQNAMTRREILLDRAKPVAA